MQETTPLPPGPPAGPAEDLTGQTLGEFRVERRLGQGGMGQVYLATQTTLKRRVALKLLRPEVAANPTALQRFRAEAEAVAQLNHPNIVQVYAVGQHDGRHFMALEYVEGMNLREYLTKKGPPELPAALSVMRQVAAALAAAGEAGLVHRDIKPENILLTRKGHAKVADFGLSRVITAAGDENLRLTQDGVTLGTPLYMSPEQVQGHAVDPRSDIYSFGVTCYHMLTGEPPFRGETAIEVALQHVQQAAKPLAAVRPDIPASLAAVIEKMMAKAAAARHQTAREVFREIARVRDGLTSATGTTPTTRLNPDQLTPIAFDSGGDAAPAAEVTGTPTEPWVPRRGGRAVWWAAGIAAAVLLAGAAGAAISVWASSPPPTEPQTQSPPTPPDPPDDDESRFERWQRGRLDAFERRLRRSQLSARDLFSGLTTVAQEIERHDPKRAEAIERALGLMEQKGAGGAAHLGRGILEAHRDRPEESLKHFEKGPSMKELSGKKLGPRGLALLKSIGLAMDRNRKNLEARGKELPEKFRRLTFPQLPKLLRRGGPRRP